MIWSSPLIMPIVDVVIIGLVIAIIVTLLRIGVLNKSQAPLTGPALLIAGIALFGLFHLTDLLLGTFLPLYFEPAAAQAAVTFLHLEIQWYTSLLSLALVSAGLLIFALQRQKMTAEMRRDKQAIERAQNEIAQSELRFRSMMENMSDAVYCIELNPPVPLDMPRNEQIERSINATFVESNRSFAAYLGVASPDAVIGSLFGALDCVKDADSYQRLYAAFAANGFKLRRYEWKYTDSKGGERVERVNFTGIVEDSALVRIWCLHDNLIEHRRISADLDSRKDFEKFVADISTRLIVSPDEHADKTMVECLESVAKFLRSDRATILQLDQATERADVAYYWNENNGRPWVEFSIQSFPWAAKQILNRGAVRISTLEEMPLQASADVARLKELGLKSAVAVPLVANDEIRGVLAFGNISDARTWSERDMIDIRVIADLFANVVVRIHSRKQLDAALKELGLAKERLEAENVYLRQEISSTHGFAEIFGESPQLRLCLHQVQQVAGTTTTVLIQGETGTGKELIARAIHERSSRADRPLVKINCAALPANLIESELFGHEKGAFTGAHSRKRGRFDLADNGSLFLDEIGDFPLELQGKLLRVIQEGEFQRLGGTETIQVDVRLIAATNRDLQAAVDNGEFRADLFYRINTFPIQLPTLAEREGDIPILAEHIAKKQAALLGKDVTAISAPLMEQLVAYSWPGNVRELESVIQRALILATGPVLEYSEPFPSGRPRPLSDLASLEPDVVDLSVAERSHIESVLRQSRWVIGGAEGAAEKLGVPASTLRSKMKKLGISRPA